MKNENLSATFEPEKQTLYLISYTIPRLSSAKGRIKEQIILFH